MLPLSATFAATATIGWHQFWHIVTAPRAIAAYRLSFGAALLAAAINFVFGTLVAWVLVRYAFPGQADSRCAGRSAVRAADGGCRHRADDDLRAERMDRAAAGCAWASTSRSRGLGIVDRADFCRACRSSCARCSRCWRISTRSSKRRRRASAPRAGKPSGASSLPAILPAALTGFALAFARGVGEYGSVIFIAGNMPMRTEIAPLLIVTKLEEYDYAGATAIARRHAGGFVRVAVYDQRAATLEQPSGAAPICSQAASLRPVLSADGQRDSGGARGLRDRVAVGATAADRCRPYSF